MVKPVTIDGQEFDPQVVLHKICTLAQKQSSMEALALFKKLAAHNPLIPNFNYVKALYLQGSSASFPVVEALRKELELFPGHKEAERLLEIAEASVRGNPQRFAEAFPSPIVFSIVLVVASDWRETHTSVRAVLHQTYPYLEVVVVQRTPDAAAKEALTALDPRVRVLDRFGASFWEAMEFGLQSSSGDYQMVVPNSCTFFSDGGLVVLATILGVGSKIEFVSGTRGYVDEHSFVNPLRVESPKFSRSSFLDERNFETPTRTLDFSGVVWSSRLFKSVGNRLAVELSEALDFELFARFFREVQLVSMALPLSFCQTKVVMGSTLPSVRYVNEAITIIREEKRLRPVGDSDSLVGPYIRPEQIVGKSAAPQGPKLIAPPAPSPKASRFLISNAPLISLIMPSYNQGQFLEQAIDSVLSQGYPRLEYMIIDGGSTDASLEIIKRYEKYLTFWCSEKDHGQYFAIQKGFDRSTGDVMGWLNSDDKLAPFALAYVGIVFSAFSHVRWISGKGGTSILESGGEVLGGETRAFSREGYLRDGFDQPYVQQEGTFWNRSLWEEAGGALDLRYSLAADCELWHRFFRFSQLHSVDLPLGLFRVQPQQKSQVLRNDYLREAQDVARKELEIINAGLYTEMRPAPAILTHADIIAAAEERAAESQS